MVNKYIGRDDFTRQIRDLLKDEKKGSLKIQSIEGPGGIGKTSLFEHSLDGIDLSDRKYLTLSLNGNEITKRGIFTAINHMIVNAKSEIKLPHPTVSYFSNVSKVMAVHGQLHAELQADEKNKKEDAINPDLIEVAFNTLTSLGKAANKISEKTKGYANFEEIEKNKADVLAAVKSSKVFLKEAPSFFEKLGLGSQTSLRNEIRENALSPLAQALADDLTIILSGYDKKNLKKPTRAKVHGVDRLLLIIDDYEVTKETFEEFLLNNFLEYLKKASFESVVIILGRDELHVTNPIWDQNFGRCMQPAIQLKPLIREEMDKLIDLTREVSIEDKDRAWRETQGYPLLVKFWLEELGSGGRTGTTLKKFHDRTTKWMTDEQKRWLNHAILVKKELDGESFQKLLGDDDEAARAWEWFKSEGSVRDHNFGVKEYVRSRLEDYLKINDPRMYRKISKIVLDSSESISA